jgi:hypothetical protein
MEITMSVKTRLRLSELLSEQSGSYLKMKAIRKAREELSLSEDEIKAVSLKEEVLPDGRISSMWDTSRDPMKKCEFSSIIVEVICEKLKKLDKEGKLTEEQMPLYEAFMVVGGEAEK